MAYQELKKLYYRDEALYAGEYRARFHSEDAVHLDFQIAGKPAFFVETPEVLRLALQIARTDKRVHLLSASLPRIAWDQYSKKCLIDEIVLTNNIEGVHSSRKEIGEALEILGRQSVEKRKGARFLGLVNKYFKLMEDTIPLRTCQDVRALYDEVFLDEVVEEDPDNRPDGRFFRRGAEAVYAPTGKVIHQGVYPEEKIISCMEQALAFLNSDSTDPLYQVCLFHYLLEYIHPFYDGNGRLGRLILSYCISKTLEPLLAYRLSETIKEHITQYYKAFRTCNDPLNLGDLTPFLLMQLELISLSMSDLERALQERLVRLRRYTGLIGSLPQAEGVHMAELYGLLIQAALFSEEGIPASALRDLLGVRSPTTLKTMLDRVPPDLLRSHIRHRVKYYELELSVLDDLLLRRAQGLEDMPS